MDIIAELIKIYSEIKRRKENNKLSLYNTGRLIHQKQLDFHKDPHKNRWVFGGNRSGKTECGAAECVYIARGIHPYRKNLGSSTGWVVSLSREVQRDVAQSKLLYYINPHWIEDVVMQQGKKGSPAYGVIDYILIKNISGKISKIGFKSCDQGREKFQGTSLDYVWFDEEPPQDIYMECKMRVFDKCGDIFGTMTPLKGLTWVYEDIYLNRNNDPEVWSINMEWADNPFLSRKEIKHLESTLSKEELESRKYGRFTSGSGLVYPEFDVNTHVIEPFDVPPEWQDNISIDPGLHNPLSCHFYAVDYDGNVYVIAEHYEADRDVNYHAARIKEICKRLNWHYTSSGYISALIDSAASQKTLASSKSVVDLFYENGIVTDIRVNKDLYSGISRVKSYFKAADGTCKLFIFKNCVNLIRELKGYYWGGGDAPVKKDDHALDELRYYIMSKPENKFMSFKTGIARDKEKLARSLKRR